jgi:hypothetical protein
MIRPLLAIAWCAEPAHPWDSTPLNKPPKTDSTTVSRRPDVYRGHSDSIEWLYR